MRVLGIFVGVDEQADQSLRALPFAAHDAEGLWAAFSDMNEADPSSRMEDTALLIGPAATRESVLHEMHEAAARSRSAEFGLAVVHFSCHGTPDGRLVLYDTHADAVAESGLSLDDLATAICLIRAHHVVVSFDTCFSGLASDVLRREPSQFIEQQMGTLGTGNRAVITATLADEPALESARLEHGLLSYGLLRGLDGTTLADAQGRVSIAGWIQHAVQSVVEQSRIEGRLQHPRLFLDWAGAPTIPAVPPGRHRHALAKRRAIVSVAADVTSLAACGFPQCVIELPTMLRAYVELSIYRKWHSGWTPGRRFLKTGVAVREQWKVTAQRQRYP